MSERLIVNSKGDEKIIHPPTLPNFPDKKPRNWNSAQVDDILIRARALSENFEIGQKEATFIPDPEYPQLPIVLLLMTDTHYGSIKTDTKLINKHLDTIANTPNFYLAHNGDSTDNFNATGKWASGMEENPVSPQLASRAWAEKIKLLDKYGKIGVLGFGNHNDFGSRAGQDWYDSFLGDFKCPIFTSGGLLNIVVGEQVYKMAMTHMWWGTSKLNPTNANKRFLEHEHPTADIVFLGHTHQSEGLQFERANQDRVAVIGGTYKDDDTYARKWGIGGRGGNPGWCVALWPNEKKMQLFKDVEVARKFITSQT